MTIPALFAHRVAEIQAHEAYLFEQAGVNPYALMQQAGWAVFERLTECWPQARRVVIAVGPGQNGGDGLVIAAAALKQGMTVHLVSFTSPIVFTKAAANAQAVLTETARECNQQPAAEIISQLQSVASLVAQADVLVDAVFGIGLDRPFEGAAYRFFEQLNQMVAEQKTPVLAVDLPSGLHADSGAVNPGTLPAAQTVTFLGLKPGLLTGAGRAHCGVITLADLNNPLSDSEQAMSVLNTPLARPPKPVGGHKGSFGTVVVLAGNRGMSGAARLAGEAALRVGAGKVMVATHPSHAATLNLDRPELMVYPVADSKDVLRLLGHADALVVGPGLGRDRWTNDVWRSLRHFEGPVVVDADGLYRLGSRSLQDNPAVITPHPGEAASMLDCSTAEIEHNRLQSVFALSARYYCTAVLKGSGTLIATDEQLNICTRGTPALATAGSGDVLSGVIGALLAAGVEPHRAAAQAVVLHGVAGEICAEQQGEWGVLAADLFAPMGRLVNQRTHGPTNRFLRI